MTPEIERSREAFFASSRRRHYQFHVRPRYTPGSPAMVHDNIALKVAKEEAWAHEQALTGIWGEDEKKRAETLGLDGIAYVMFEKGSGRQFRWHVWDLITNVETRRLHQNELHRLGYYRFEHLQQTVQARLVQPGCRYPDYDREFYKLTSADFQTWEQYKPEIVRV
jgi:hypothetical protein